MTVKQMAGHGPYSKMLTEHYVHIREKVQRVAVDALPRLRTSLSKIDHKQAGPQRNLIVGQPVSLDDDPLEILHRANGI
jgi:hypothetical protein